MKKKTPRGVGQPEGKAAFPPLRKRMLTLLLAAAMLPMMAMLVMASQGMLQGMEREVTQSLRQALRQTVLNLEGRFESAVRVSDLLAGHPQVQKALYSDPASQGMRERIEELKRLRETVENAQSSADVSVRLFVREDKMYARERINFFPLSWFERDAAGMPPLPGFVTTTVYTLENNWPLPRETVAYVRRIRSASSIGQTVGALAVDIDREALTRSLEALSLPSGGEAFLLDSNGAVFWTDAPDSAPPVPQTGQLDASGEAAYAQDNDMVLLFRLSPADWLFLVRIPQRSVRAFALAGRSGLLYLMAFATLYASAFFLIAAVMARRVSRQVDSLAAVFGEGGQAAQGRGGSLFRQLDDSLGRAKALVGALYEQMRVQRHTQLQMLQEQINPHFLYNTLDTLQWLVRGGDTQAAVRAIGALTRYLRLILNNGKDNVTVSDEVRLAEAYLEIQRLRYKDAFETRFDADKDALRCLLPKMTLQPLLENAIQHGFRSAPRRADDPGRIDVRILIDNGALVLTVTDNGEGIPPENLPLPTPPDQRGADSGKGFAMRNVHERILLFSGGEGAGDFGLSAESERGTFTRITARIALRSESDQTS